MSHISKTDTDQIFVQHFSSGSCKGAKVSVQVIEEWDGNGRIDQDPKKKMCPSEATLRRKKETEWMLRLRTIYPYGLNMKVTDKTNMDKLDTVEGTIKGILFPPLPRSSARPPLTPQNARVSNDNFDPLSYVDTIKNNFLNDKKNSFYITRINLFSLKKSNLRVLATHLFDVLKNCDEDLHSFFL